MTSEASSSVNLLDAASVGPSMASSPSGCSIVSDADRASPFLPASALNSSPSSPSPYLRQIDFGASTSRSSLDSTRPDFGEQLAQNAGAYRRRRRTNSSDSSGSDDGSVGGASHVSSIGGFSRSQDNDEDAEGSRKTSMETPIRQADMPRGRLANIRRESSCTPSDEMAHERLTTAGIQVSSGWDDALRIGGGEEEESAGAAAATSSTSSTTAASPAAAAAAAAGCKDEEFVMRRRAPSASASSSNSSQAGLSELSILTHAWIPHSCSPSPTRMSESTKQCYSPSTQKIVRPNIPYSPSPSPTASPTRKRLMTARSQSPIASRSALKRRVDCLPSSPVSMSGGTGAGGGSPMGLGGDRGGMQLQLLQGFSNGSSASSASSFTSIASSSSFSSSSFSSSSSTQPPPEKRPCPGGAMGGYVRNSTSPLVTMDARTQAAALAIRRHSLFLVDPEIRRASTESYAEIDPAAGGSAGDTRDSGDSLSEPSSVLMPVSDDAFDPDALLFRAPSVPPPLSVGSNCSSKYETAATDADDTKSTIDGEEEKMDEEGIEDPNMSSSSS